MDFEMDMEWPTKIHMDYGFFMDFQSKSLWIMDFLWIFYGMDMDLGF